MAGRATTCCSAAAAPTVSLAGMAKTSSTATRATTSPSSAPATTCSNGIRATAATRSKARPAPIRWCSANGQRVRLTRGIGNITLDLNGVERIQLNALSGADTITVNDLTETDVKQVAVDLSAPAGSGQGDGQPDAVIVNGTAGDDHITVASSGASVVVNGLPAKV